MNDLNTDHLTPETLQRYRAGTLAPEQWSLADTHLSECPSCRERLRTALTQAAPRLAVALLPEPGDPFCPDEALLTRYVEETAPPAERELMEAHLPLCARCREDVESLRQFRIEMHDYDWKQVRAPGWRERFQDARAAWPGLVKAIFASAFQRWNRLPLSGRILVALVLGLLTGWQMGHSASTLQAASEGVIHLLGAVAAPLIFLAVIHALIRAPVTGATFGRLIGLLLTNTLVAIGFGLLVINLFHPGTRVALASLPGPNQALPPVPHSLLEPLLENNILFVVLLAVGFGIALRGVRHEEREAGRASYRAVEEFLEVAYRCLMRMLQWVIALVPLAVFASAANLVGAYGRKPFESLGGFVLCVLLALAMQVAYYLLRLRMASHVRPLALLRETRSALLTAFSTASSAATMPLAYERVTQRLGVREASSSLGILVGGNINRDGTALFEAMGVLFIAQALGQHLGVGQQCVVALMAVIASVCAPGIPEAGLVTMVLVFQSLRLPDATYIVLLIPLDWLLDRCRTSVSVLGHMTVACLLDGRTPPAPVVPPPDLSVGKNK